MEKLIEGRSCSAKRGLCGWFGVLLRLGVGEMEVVESREKDDGGLLGKGSESTSETNGCTFETGTKFDRRS